MYSENVPFGAGTQLVSLSLPGDFAPKYSVSDPSGLYFRNDLLFVPSGVAVQRVRGEEVVFVVKGDGPKALHRGFLTFRESHSVVVGSIYLTQLGAQAGIRLDRVGWRTSAD